MGILYRIWLVFLPALQQPNQKVPNHIAKLDTSQGENRNGKKTEILLTCLRLKSCLLCHVWTSGECAGATWTVWKGEIFFFSPAAQGTEPCYLCACWRGGKITGRACSVWALCWAQELPNREGLGGRGVPAKIRISTERFQCPGQLYSLAELEMHRAPATPCLCNTERLLGGVRIQIAPDNSQLMWEKYRALFLFSGEKEKNKFKYVFWTDDSNHHAVICPCSFRMNVWRMFGKQIWTAFLCYFLLCTVSCLVLTVISKLDLFLISSSL